MKYYAGIGSRETPDPILRMMYTIALRLSSHQYILRSGGAPGADTFFEKGAFFEDEYKQIFLPWKGFNGNRSNLWYIPPEAFEITARYHPAWKRLNEPARKLMARNAQQILGENLDTPVEFVICWTPDGCTRHETRTKETGGTGQAISIASSHGIPVYNLKNEIDQQLIVEMLDYLEHIRSI